MSLHGFNSIQRYAGILTAIQAQYRAMHTMSNVYGLDDILAAHKTPVPDHTRPNLVMVCGKQPGNATTSRCNGGRRLTYSQAISSFSDTLGREVVAQAQGHVPDMAGPQILTLEDMGQTYLQALGKQRHVHVDTMGEPSEYHDAFFGRRIILRLIALSANRPGKYFSNHESVRPRTNIPSSVAIMLHTAERHADLLADDANVCPSSSAT